MKRMRNGSRRERRETDLSDAVDLSLAQFSELIAEISQGPLEPVPWKSALDLLRGYLRANYVTLMLRPPTPEREALMVNAAGDAPVVAARGARVAEARVVGVLRPEVRYARAGDGAAIAYSVVGDGPITGSRWSVAGLNPAHASRNAVCESAGISSLAACATCRIPPSVTLLL